MSERITVSSGAKWEELVGYSRAVRVGAHVAVTGTIGWRDGAIVGEDDAYAQSVEALAIVRRALEEAGATMEDVVRTRIFVTDIGRWEEVGRAHREALGHVRPATTMVEVAKLIVPEAIVEIEADAIVG